MDPQEAWTEANRLLNSGGSLTDATLLLESYLRRAADVNAGEPAAKELAAWSLLGKTHAMNEKEEKALAAFEEGRQAIKGGGAEAGMGDMLTVSRNPHSSATRSLTSESRDIIRQRVGRL
jgi:peroxin-5